MSEPEYQSLDTTLIEKLLESSDEEDEKEEDEEEEEDGPNMLLMSGVFRDTD